MPYFGQEEREIAALKERIAADREQIGRQANALVPSARSLAKTGTILKGLRRALPIIRPIAFSVLRGIAAKKGKKKWLKFAGIGVVAFGAWKMLADNSEDSE